MLRPYWCCFLLSLFLGSGAKELWAVLVAGSRVFEAEQYDKWILSNYRHQAGLCHAYRLLLDKGFSEDHIVTLSYNDAATHDQNPIPNTLFNLPDPSGPGVDLYEGCKVDYAGDNATKNNFLGLMIGGKTTGGSGKVLGALAGDHVFVYYVDHGLKGALKFPDGSNLSSSEFQDMIRSMRQREKYGKMVFFIEACHAGSMFDMSKEDLDVLDVFGITAVAADALSQACYCRSQNTVNGTSLGTCLGDIFSVYWMELIARATPNMTFNELFDKQDVARVTGDLRHQRHVRFGDVGDVGSLSLESFFFPGGHRPMPPLPLPVFVEPTLQSRRISCNAPKSSSFSKIVAATVVGIALLSGLALLYRRRRATAPADYISM